MALKKQTAIIFVGNCRIKITHPSNRVFKIADGSKIISLEMTKIKLKANGRKLPPITVQIIDS